MVAIKIHSVFLFLILKSVWLVSQFEKKVILFVYFSSPLWSNNCETDIDNDMFSLKFEEKQKKEPKENEED